MAAGPDTWLLPFWADHPDEPDGDGRPWGDGTAMAARARATPPQAPWDSGCSVTSYIGGQPAMAAMRDIVEEVIAAAPAMPPFDGTKWARGHVYLTDWRFNCFRDMSVGTDRWNVSTTDDDATAIGLILRLMQVGVQVRLLLWHPIAPSRRAGLAAHIEDHLHAAQVVALENERLMKAFGAGPNTDPLGVVVLDLRVAQTRIAGSHHQKMMVVRTPQVSVAFAGGVDLAFTRRDAPLWGGDWQSGANIPPAGAPWPRQPGVDYSSIDKAERPSASTASDLPAAIYGTRQSWHDQHLRVSGPIVSTLESQFTERWRDSATAYDLTKSSNWTRGQVIVSTPAAISDKAIKPLPDVVPVTSTPGQSIVQMWRTMPWRNERKGPPFRRSEYTVMAGIANAVTAASELIWIFDQYFWSLPLARLLHRQLQANPGLRLIIVLPAHADDRAPQQHRARANALAEVVGSGADSVASRIAVYAMWDASIRQSPPAADPPFDTSSRGTYVHAKVQTYDGSLLVCGSANLNRRSFNCDSELALAVFDPAVVASHQRRLWEYLFPASPWPQIDIGAKDGGAEFFAAFRAAGGVDKAGAIGPGRVIVDPWDIDDVRLPSGALRVRASNSPAFDWFYTFMLDPSSINTVCEEDAVDPDTGKSRPANLSDVVHRIEREYQRGFGDRITWPYRKQAW